jgi:periplasmic protein CpxP/Spy
MKVAVAGRLMVAVAGILLGSALAVAQGPGGMGPGMGPGGMGRGGFGQRRPPMERALGAGQWWNNPRMVTQLKLADDQRKAMDGILLQHREKLIDLQGTLQKAELEMQPLMKADQPNETQILAQIDKVASARAELEKANARFLLAIRAKLTPDQWKQLQDLRANGMGRQQADGRGQGPKGGQYRRGPGGGPGSRQGTPPPPPQDGSQAPAPAPGAGGEQ